MKETMAESSMLEKFKALSNENRIEILEWLKSPSDHFTHTNAPDGWDTGVCIMHIQQKANLAFSTISNHISILHRAGFVEITKVGQWSYCRRNEHNLLKFYDDVRHI